MRFLLVDDHYLFRQGLRAMLESDKSYNVVGEAGDGSEAVNLVGELKPEIVVMDISMPDYDGLEATRQIKEYYPKTIVIVLSGYTDNIFVDQALKAGASAYVYKDAAFNELSFAIDAVSKGMSYLSPAVLQPVISGYLSYSPEEGATAEYDKLTAREKEVFNLMVKGRSRSIIAQTLHISPKTVDRHRSNLLKKLNRHDETELKEFARLLGMID